MLTRLCLLALLATAVVALAAPGPASAAVNRKCGNTNHGAGLVHTKNLKCRKGRRIANFYETHGRCPRGWKLRQFGRAPSPPSTGGTWDECKKNGRWVRWTETGE